MLVSPPGEDLIYRKKCKRHNYPGTAHFLTFSCYRRLPLLSRDRTRQWALSAIATACKCHAFDLWAYVIMPEHMHVIIMPKRRDYSVSAWLKTMKREVSCPAVAWLKENAPDFLQYLAATQRNGKITYRFWQRGGGYDRDLVSADEVWEKITYVHRNPVRRKLCELPSEWCWSSAVDFTGKGKGPLKLQHAQLPR